MLGDDSDLDAVERWVDGWHAAIDERAARAKDLSQRLTGLAVTARSRDGLVEVTASSTGAVTGLRLDERVRRHSATWTAQQILAVIGDAYAQLAEQVAQATEETVGLDNPTGQAIVDSFTRRLAGDPGASR